MNSDIRDIIAKLEAQGWTVVRGKHYKCYPPDKNLGMVVVSCTPSDPRAIKNAISYLRRHGAIL
jgi:predicted RNA binding protein YcfA (HicA-like mRNA interferase family)